MFSFQHPHFLWLLFLVLPLAALYRYAVLKKQRIATNMGDPALIQELTKSYLPSRYRAKFIVLVVALVLMVIALAHPRKAGGSVKVVRSGIDLVIALDVSNSMLAEDVTPTRLDRARQVMYRLVDKLENHRIAIVVFAGKAYLQMPLTADHSAAKMYINAASPALVTVQGTALAEALKRSSQAFNNKEKKYRAVILISDGEDHDEGAVTQAEEMFQSGIIVNTIGIGSTKGAVVKDLKTGGIKNDASGNPVVSILNEEVLQKIALAGNGNYHFFSETDAAVRAMEDAISKMEQRDIVDESNRVYQSLYMYPLCLALLLLLIEMMITDKRKIPTVSVKPAFTVLLLLFAFVSQAQSMKFVEEGNKLFEEGKYEEAVKQYDQAAKIKPGFIPLYNQGNALFKNKQPEEALSAYRAAIEKANTPAQKALAWYNSGVVLQQSDKLDECIAAYKEALKLAPDDAEARHNLQKALKEKRKQQQQQEQQKQQPQKNQQQQQQKQSPSKLTKKEAETKLRALQQQERNLQDKLRKQEPAPASLPEKDW